MSSEPQWIVTLASGSAPAVVARALRQAGFQVEQVLDEIGCVTGRASAAVADAVRRVPAVADVAGSGPVDVGPPGAEPS
jgi:hypothetical protein